MPDEHESWWQAFGSMPIWGPLAIFGGAAVSFLRKALAKPATSESVDDLTKLLLKQSEKIDELQEEVKSLAEKIQDQDHLLRNQQLVISAQNRRIGQLTAHLKHAGVVLDDEEDRGAEMGKGA